MKKLLYFLDPLSGRYVQVNRLDKMYQLKLAYKIMVGGRNGISWQPAEDGVYKFIKHKLIVKLEKLIDKYKELNGCDYWSDCLTCMRTLENCPDHERGLALKMEKATRADKIKALYADGWRKDDIAREFKICERTVRRDLKAKGGK